MDGQLAYLGIQHCNILNVGIVDVIFDPGILANTTHTNSMCSIAEYVLDKDVGRVRFWAEAVVTNIDPGVADSKSIDVV